MVMKDEPWDAAKATVPTGQMIGHGTAAGIQPRGVKIVSCLSYLIISSFKLQVGLRGEKFAGSGMAFLCLYVAFLLVRLCYFCPPTDWFLHSTSICTHQSMPAGAVIQWSVFFIPHT
jgi:hypothetical protein